MISRLRVQNYKSLKDLDLPLRPLTIFVGPNNAGKSNIFDSLLVLRDLVNLGPGAVESRGGFRDIVWNGELGRTISIKLEGEITWQVKRPFLYEIELAGGPAHFSLTTERFAVRVKGTERLLLRADPSQPVADIYDEGGKHLSGLPRAVNTSALRSTNSPEGYGTLGHFSQAVSALIKYKLDPDSLKTLPQVRRDLLLQSRGSNLSSVLHTFQTSYPQQFQRIRERLKAIVPELRNLYTPLTEQGQTYVEMDEEGLSKPMPLWTLADGTLHALAILTTLYASTPPWLMCFEEPENYVHPRVLEVLAKAFREASQQTQILITTHSAYFLDHFRAQDLVIVEKAQGATQVNPVSKRKGVREALRTLGLGEFWYSGALGGVPR